VTGFGDHDGPHFGRVVEAATGQWLASVDLRALPTDMAPDGERGYFGTMGGEVAVAPRAVAGTAKGPDLGWRMVRTFDAHPRTARSASAAADGLVQAVAFLDEQRLAVGGNDDWAAVFDAGQGKQLWRSRKLGEDVERIAVCERGFGVMTAGGEVTVFGAARSGRSFVAQKPIAQDMAWSFGMTPGCAIVVDASDDTFTVYAQGRKQFAFSTPGRFDRRRLVVVAGPHLPVVGPHLVLSQPGRLEVQDMAAATAAGKLGQPVAVYETHPWDHDGKLSQAWMLGDGRLLREYCGEVRCVVELVGKDRGAPWTLELDTRGGIWDMLVPSMIAAALSWQVTILERP
jgi:hypothetical protein